MLTEQEVAAYINEKLAKKELKDSSVRYANKLRALESILNSHNDALKDLSESVRNIELEIQRTKGAISMVLELVAEEEGLITPASPTS
jgi:predicted  nucleic acid-binding Zn-ribbon protein